MANVTLVNVAQVFADADMAGKAAVEAANVVPMRVVQRANPLDDSSPVVHDYGLIADGVCGFAWVNIKPANSKAAKFAVERLGARKDSYYGGVTVWIHQFDQSMQKKEAYAYAFAKTLRDADIKAYANSRMD